jgi:hypothetical protein
MNDKPITEITERVKKAIMDSLRAGLPPSVGLQYLAVGRKLETKALCLDIDNIQQGASACRFLKGPVGAGKTFLENVSFGYGIAANLVVAKTDFTIEHRLQGSDGRARGLYTALMSKLRTKSSGEMNALRLIIESWLSAVSKQCGDGDIQAAIYRELRPLRDYPLGAEFADVLHRYWEAFQQDNCELLDATLKWLRAEFGTKTEARQALGLKHCKIITDADMYSALKVFASFCRLAGHGGLLLVFDELANLCNRLPNGRARDGNFAVLHTIVDESFQGMAPGLGFVFAGTDEAIEDEERGLFSYPPLRSRLKPTNAAAPFTLLSPIIPLAPLAYEEVFMLLRNIVIVHALGDSSKLQVTDENIQSFLERSVAGRTQSKAFNPRDIVKPFVEMLASLEANPQARWADVMKDFSARTTT